MKVHIILVRNYNEICKRKAHAKVVIAGAIFALKLPFLLGLRLVYRGVGRCIKDYQSLLWVEAQGLALARRWHLLQTFMGFWFV